MDKFHRECANIPLRYFVMTTFKASARLLRMIIASSNAPEIVAVEALIKESV